MDGATVAQIITFIVVVYLLYRAAAKPVGTLFTQRTSGIEESLRTAKESQRRAAETQAEAARQLEAARRDAQDIIASAQRAAEAQRQALIEQAKAEAASLVERSRAAVERERQAAVDQLRREAARLAMLAATRVVTQSVDTTINQRLVESAIAEVGGKR